MPKKRTSSKSTVTASPDAPPTNAKLCEQCNTVNSFKRVKCEKCGALLPEGKFERARRMREQLLRRERQLSLNSTLFRDKALILDDLDESSDLDPVMQGVLRGDKRTDRDDTETTEDDSPSPEADDEPE